MSEKTYYQRNREVILLSKKQRRKGQRIIMKIKKNY